MVKTELFRFYDLGFRCHKFKTSGNLLNVLTIKMISISEMVFLDCSQLLKFSFDLLRAFYTFDLNFRQRFEPSDSRNFCCNSENDYDIRRFALEL